MQFVIFLTYRTFPMNYTSFSIYEFVSNLFELREGHVACFYWSVPIRPDHAYGPLDLK
jgi:hypothetical protein